MRPVSKFSSRGFSLIELLISLAVGLIVMGAAVQLYSSATDVAWVVQQRSEMQQDLRAAEDMIVRDISLAGSGLTGINGESIALPSGTTPQYGCTTATTCSPQYNYPCVGAACVPTLYPIMPGYQKGIIPPGSATKSDVITVAYTDANLAIWCYPFTYTSGSTTITLTAPASTTNCNPVLPPGLVYPQAPNNPYTGLKAGDLVMMQNNTGGAAIGEVTAVSPANPGNTAPTPCTGTPCTGGSSYTITFASSDPLKLNQTASSSYITAVTGGTALYRLLVITYYLANWTDANGDVTTILYRQVNGQSAIPLVDNIANLQLTYDTYNSSGALLNASGDGGESGGTSPNLIRKVNLAHLTIHSQIYGVRSAYSASGYQSFDVQTSVSTRNMSYNNRY